MSGAIPPLPQYAFMSWCSVKVQGQLTFYLYIYYRYGIGKLNVVEDVFNIFCNNNNKKQSPGNPHH